MENVYFRSENINFSLHFQGRKCRFITLVRNKSEQYCQLWYLILLPLFLEGKPNSGLAQRAEVGVWSGRVFRFMTPRSPKIPILQIYYICTYVRIFVSSWPSHNSRCKKAQKRNAFECRPLHCYEAELLDICRQDSTYITVGVYGI